MNRFIVYMLAFGVFFVGTAEMVVAGILNEIAGDLHISIALAGQLITAFSLAFAIGTPIVVALTSRIDRKKLLIGSLAVFIVGSFFSFVSSTYTMLVVSRVIVGVSAGVYIVVAMGSITKLVPPEKLGSSISLIPLAFGLALTLGVPIGIVVSNWWSWSLVFALLGLASFLVMLGLMRLLPQIEGDAPVPFLKQFSVLTNPFVVSGLFFSLFINMSNSTLLTYVTPFLTNVFHLGTSQVGGVMLIFGIVGMLGSRLGGYGADRWGTVRTIVVSVAITVVSLAFLPLFAAPLIVGLMLIIFWMLSLFIGSPALQTYFVQQAPQSANLILSLNTSVVHVGIALGAAAGGMFVNTASTVLYHPWGASILAILGLLVGAVSFSRVRRKHAQMKMQS
jgi:DHA1 family putative efflux transporter-like MFS transporter